MKKHHLTSWLYSSQLARSPLTYLLLDPSKSSPVEIDERRKYATRRETKRTQTDFIWLFEFCLFVWPSHTHTLALCLLPGVVFSWTRSLIDRSPVGVLNHWTIFSADEHEEPERWRRSDWRKNLHKVHSFLSGLMHQKLWTNNFLLWTFSESEPLVLLLSCHQSQTRSLSPVVQDSGVVTILCSGPGGQGSVPAFAYLKKHTP